MKRTKERIDLYHPTDRKNISGARIFDGEDLSYGDRSKMQQMQQKDWIEQQKREKEMKQDMEKNETDIHAQQTLYLNQVRGMMEDESTKKRKEMMKAMQQENLLLAQQKKDRETQKKSEELNQDRVELDYVNGSAIMTEDTNTCQSQLGPGRVIPYHWKGMNEEQKRSVMDERTQQIHEKGQSKKNETEEERLWALQNEAHRSKLIANELDLKRKQKMMAESQKEDNLNKAVEHKERWDNYYGDKDPLPEI